MTLADAIAANFHKPRATVRIGGRRFYPLSITVSNSFETGTISAQIELSSEEAERLGTDFGNEVEADLGYDPEETAAFRGSLEDDDPGFWPHGNVVQAVGPMKKTHQKYPTEVIYENETDIAIVTDLLERCGITGHSVEGAGLVLGTVEPVVLRAGGVPFEVIRLIDEMTRHITIDGPDGIVRRRPNSGLPNASPAWTYIQGVNIIDIDAPRATSTMKNKVIVRGRPQGDFTPSATRQADNSYIPDPPGYLVDEYTNDLVETDAIADEYVAIPRLKRVNRIRREIVVQAAGNPLIYPGMTTGVQAEKVFLHTLRPYLVKGISHTWRPAEFTTRMAMEGGDADAGYPVVDRPEGGVKPEPVMELVVTAESWLVAGTPTRFYTVSGNGRGSFHPNRPPGNITYAWSNSENGDTSTSDRYSTYFTEAELATAEITLTVTDVDNSSLTKSITQKVQAETVPIIAKALAVALNDILAVSLDGGLTWVEFEAPFVGASTRRYTIVAELNHDGIFWAGAIGSTAFGTDAHWLVAIDMGRSASQDIPAHNFGSAADREITAIWVHELDDNRVIVGLANGDVWATSNALGLELSRWEKLVTLPTQVEWLVESFSNRGEIRAAAGESLYITFDGFASYGELTDFAGGTAYRSALSPFGNYASGALSPDAVRGEDGVAITLPGGTPDEIRGLTHHIRRDVLFAGDRAGQTYVKDEGASTFTAAGALASLSPINHMLRDGDNMGALYLAADDGIYKSYNEGETWNQMISWNPVTYPDRQGLRIGYADLPIAAAEAARGCITDFSIREEYTGPATGGGHSWYMHASREGSAGPWQDQHSFAIDGTWEISMTSLSNAPLGFPGLAVHVTTISPVGDAIIGTLADPSDPPITIDHPDGVSSWYIYLNELEAALPSHYSIAVCRTTPAGTDVLTLSGTAAKVMLVTGERPPDWFLTGYSDGLWAAAVDLGEPNDTYTTAPLIWRNDVVSPPAEEVLFRHTIASPGLTVVNSAYLLIRANNSIQAIYINGEFIGEVPASGDASGDSDPHQLAIDPGLLNPDGTNLLAIHAINEASGGGDTLAWVSYKLLINGE